MIDIETYLPQVNALHLIRYTRGEGDERAEGTVQFHGLRAGAGPRARRGTAGGGAPRGNQQQRQDRDEARGGGNGHVGRSRRQLCVCDNDLVRYIIQGEYRISKGQNIRWRLFCRFRIFT